MHFFDQFVGLHSEWLEPYQMAARALVVFALSLLLIRIAGIRTLGKQSAFDIITSMMLGAILGRSVVANQSFFGSILAALVIMLLHRLTAWITFRSKKAEAIIKGKNLILMKNGKKNQKNLRRAHITEEDIQEAMRHQTNSTAPEKIIEVHLERSGDISIINE